MTDRGRICAFTGHRAVPDRERDRIRKALVRTVESLYADGFRTFCAGGAMGFDRMAAETVLALKQKYPDLRLALVLPCRDQAERWAREERDIYLRQMRDADEVEVLSEHYYDGCMRARNRSLIDRAEHLVAYVTTCRSGSAQTLRMAEEKGIPVTNLA